MNDRLMPITANCIDAGMHVHLDKPGGESFSAFKKVLDEAGQRNLTILGYMYRDNPAVLFCQRAVREGWLGQLFEVDCVRNITHSLEYRKVSFPPPAGRYDDQLIELAQIIRGERENPYPLEHELLVQQCLLESCGYLTS